MIVGELNRIASHLIAFGTYGLDIGAFTPFLHAIREREAILNIFEKICGARLMYTYYDVGGVKWDIPDDAMEEIKLFVEMFPKKLKEYDTLLSTNEIFIQRTAKSRRDQSTGTPSTTDAAVPCFAAPESISI